MDNDDQQVGRLLTRREALTMLAAAGAAMLVGCGPASSSAPVGTAATQAGGTATALNTEAATAMATAAVGGASAAQGTTTEAATAVRQTAMPAGTATGTTATTAASAATALPSCVVTPALTEGPYFVDEKLNRSDIRSDPADGSVKAGVPLTLQFTVSQISGNGCTPLQGATVDVWHCDAQGVYSDVTDRGFTTKGKKFLRGYQTTDAQGVATFATIYPGWYAGRAVHIHFKVRGAAAGGKNYEFTSQLFFDDALTDQVDALAPYAARGRRDTPNSADGIYSGGGEQLVLAATKSGQGYATSFHIGVNV